MERFPEPMALSRTSVRTVLKAAGYWPSRSSTGMLSEAVIRHPQESCAVYFVVQAVSPETKSWHEPLHSMGAGRYRTGGYFRVENERGRVRGLDERR